ncbi:centromere protein X isoform X2 [Mus musculus]|uniref:centromere protein X isoform X2 n=1 Tax=Mus musculus TaxID=10090 RepID=UPI0011AEBF0E|nr:centromere protein X isoform X2 [Mus musculus]
MIGCWDWRRDLRVAFHVHWLGCGRVPESAHRDCGHGGKQWLPEGTVSGDALQLMAEFLRIFVLAHFMTFHQRLLSVGSGRPRQKTWMLWKWISWRKCSLSCSWTSRVPSCGLQGLVNPHQHQLLSSPASGGWEDPSSCYLQESLQDRCRER